jgi:transcriptional regulator of arginine metabolism
MGRKERFGAIAEVLKEHPTGSQAELREILLRRGIEVSQSSLSRDLSAMGAYRRRNPDGSYSYVLPDPKDRPEADLRARFGEAVTGMSASGNIVLVFTRAADAPGVARLLDSAAPRHLLGTVAGDDTVICVADSAEGGGQLLEALNGMME